MAIPKIEELNQSEQTQETRLAKNHPGKPCIYYPEQTCSCPNLKFKICSACPRATSLTRHNIVKSVFNKIKGLAIFLLQGAKTQTVEQITAAKLRTIGGAKETALAAMPGLTLSEKEDQLQAFVAGAKAAARAGTDFFEWVVQAGVPRGAISYLLAIYNEASK